MTLRELAAALEDTARDLDRGNAYDRAWANHLRDDARSLRQLASADRHLVYPPVGAA